MIQFGIFVPLLISGMAGAAFRHYKQRRDYADIIDLPALTDERPTASRKQLLHSPPRVFDDIGEIHHYQHTAWYALAFIAAGYWFFPPVALIGLPLLGYNSYHFYQIVRHSDPATKKTPLALFEGIGIVGSLLTGRALLTSTIFLLSFGLRKLLLQAGNISNNIGLTNAINPRTANVWVLRDDAEIEITLTELQPNDIVILHAGDTIVVPGKVTQGTASISQFSLQKQMKRVPKQAGDQVFPFTKVHSGYLHVQPT